MKKNALVYLAILIFSIIVSIPLLVPYLKTGYFPTHDGEWAVVRLSDMVRLLLDFQIPPRYSGNLNFGYGYPLFNFVYPFPYYLGSFFHLLGLGLVDSVKAVFALSIPISAFFMFLASRNIWKNDYAGVVATVLYLYFPYRLVDLFVRGSIGESLAFAIFPIILFCISKSYESRNRIFYLISGALSLAILITSHNIMAVLFLITLFIFFIIDHISKKENAPKTYLFIVLFGLLLSAYFSLPALIEKGNIVLSQIPIADRSQFFLTLKDFIVPSWGFGVPTDRRTGFSYQIGIPFLIVISLSFGLILYNYFKKIKIDPDHKRAILLLLAIGFFVFMLFPVSSFVWRLPLLSEINFPWTVLSQIGLLTVVLSGFIAKNRLTKYLAVFSAILALVFYIPLAKPSEYVNRGDGFYFTNDATTTSSNELMPLWVKVHPTSRTTDKVETVEGNAKIQNLQFNSKKIVFNTESDSSSVVRINTIYYPGWVVLDNGKLANIDYDNDFGVMDMEIAGGTHNISAFFSETKTRLLADMISVITLFTLVAILAIYTSRLFIKK